MSTLATLTALLLLTWAATAPGLAAEPAAGGALDAQKILSASDAVRNPDKPFGLSILLIEYRNAKEVDSNTLAIYSKLESSSGRYRTLVSYVGQSG